MLKNKDKNDIIVMSVGGSLIVPDEIDVPFLKNLKNLILSMAKEGREFVIITGGGRTARMYQGAAKSSANPTDHEPDMLGVHALNLNAELFRVLFKDVPNVSIYGAKKPGSSTDLGAVLLAKKFGAKQVINLSNINYAYDKDPRKYKDAKKIEQISWKEFRKLIPKKWSPGLSSPFDPIASQQGQKLGLAVAIINGNKLSELKNFLDNKQFAGTLIR